MKFSFPGRKPTPPKPVEDKSQAKENIPSDPKRHSNSNSNSKADERVLEDRNAKTSISASDGAGNSKGKCDVENNARGETELGEEDKSMRRGGGLYRVSKFYQVENVEYYRKGGYHPVLIGDEFKDGQYKVVHKLGNGGYATVWLARDWKEERYVAIKIVLCEFSQEVFEKDTAIMGRIKACRSRRPRSLLGNHIDVPIDYFWVEGPNGRHLGVVSHFSGPSIALCIEKQIRPGERESRRMALQLAQSLAFLHSPSVGIVHGDLTTSNVLLELKNIDSWSEKKLYQKLGPPAEERVYASNRRPLGPEAPTFLYEAADLNRLLNRRTGNIRVIDFGESFFISSPPNHGLGTPASFCSPELLSNKTCGTASDIWALACTIFELRKGYLLIHAYLGTDREALAQIVARFGPPPAHLESLKCLQDYVQEIRGPNLRGMVKSEETEKDDKAAHATINDEETEAFLDLLRGAMDYDIEERFTAAELLEHPWFADVF